MGNRRFTLAVPPFSISNDDTEIHVTNSKQLSKNSPSPMRSSPRIIRRIDHEREEVELEDWLNFDKFPPLTPGQGKPLISFGLPKHSQPTEETRQGRLHDQRPPPVVAIGSNSILVGDLPIQFRWNSKARDEKDEDKSKLPVLPRMKALVCSEVHSGHEAEDGKIGGTVSRASWAREKALRHGPDAGLSIEDLFQHSYCPSTSHPPDTKAKPSHTTRWFWIPSARVWDPTAERFPATPQEIWKFGKQAKHLRRVSPRILDGRSFIEVVANKMDRKGYQGREVREGDRYREGRFQEPERQSREGFQETRDLRGGYPNQTREGFQGRDGRVFRSYQDQPRGQSRGWDQGGGQNRKREGDRQEVRDVRRMTEEDLRHKLEERKKGEQQSQHQQHWDSGQSASMSIRCFNCNDLGHHISTCKKPPFCYSCRASGHKSTNCPSTRANKGLTLCAMGMPGQLFYALNIPEIKPEEKEIADESIRALVSVLEGRGTKFRIKTELQYLVDSEWNWDVKRISGSEFIVSIPSKPVMNLLTKMQKIKFITSDMVAVIEETDREPDTFQTLQTVWVRAMGIPNVARTEFAVLELAKLVGFPEEVHIPSLQWKAVWVKVSCKDPYKIGGASEVFINKKGKKISWFYSDKLPQHPPTKPDDDDFDINDGEVTDEEDPESQESHGWLETGKSPPKGPTSHGAGPSNYQGRQSSNLDNDRNGAGGSNETSRTVAEDDSKKDLIQEITDLAENMQVRSTIKNYSDQRELLADLGFMEISEEMPVESNKNYAVPTEKLTPEVFSTQENLSGQSDEPELNEDKNNDHEVEVVTSKSKCAEGTVPVSAKSTSILIDTIRHSSRLKEDGTTMMAKAMNKKASAASKGAVKMRKPGKRSRERDAYFYSDHNDEKDKYFFKVLVGDFRERLAVPEKFEQHFRGLIGNRVKLESRCGHTFDVEVAKNLGKVVLQTGWKEFVTAHDLNMGDFLVFKCDKTSRFKVFIFDLSCCEKVPPCLVKRNHICGRETREMHIEISSSCGDLPMNVTTNSSTSLSDSSGDSVRPEDQKSHCVPGYILPRGTCLTCVQMKKLKERVRASSSRIPIYGCIINNGNVHGRSQALDQTLMLRCRGKSWEVRCVIKKDKKRVKRLMKGWKQFARDNKLRLGDLCLFELLENTKYTMNVHVIRAK
ncbi:uncharacterized protein LOC8062495 isoform X2 [Sorghum bicolor]|uniref:uncharacterized protein LOC8062495 isoform X2 n=1 Tax=Sorghum bicolor TaxID=4558 RepID=UPI000B425E01|nr:uncharacterized protein LOC8062495 isoform X2 [Sorghum bicolor]|eukprot:XP_021304717.1 uncharacterized protein LOC8062495 isoform X2 [Sorghum bicolor]